VPQFNEDEYDEEEEIVDRPKREDDDNNHLHKKSKCHPKKRGYALWL
jgi:hypothetical protein